MFLARTTFLLLIAFGVSSATFSQAKKPITKSGLQEAACKAGTVSFPCPKGFHIVKLAKPEGKFLAQKRLRNSTFSIFVLQGLAVTDVDNAIEREFVPLMFPQTSAYRWKDLDYINPDRASSFEVGNRMRMGFDKTNLTMFSYRTIEFHGKRFTVGSVWRDKMGRADAQELFSEVDGGTEGEACYDVGQLIRAVTNENPTEGFEPCKVDLFQSIKSDN